MKKCIVINNAARIITLKTTLHEIDLIPGKNNVSVEALNHYAKEVQDLFEHYIAQGILKVYEDLDETIQISQMEDVEKIRDIIQNTMNIAELELFHNEENKKKKPRNHILKLIEKQISEIKRITEKSKQEEN